MATLKDRVLALVRTTPGPTDREITDHLLGSGAPQQGVNQIARALAGQRLVARRPRHDGKLGNYPDDPHLASQPVHGPLSGGRFDSLSEADVKRNLQAWLENAGWKAAVISGRGQGIDIEAAQPGRRRIIEAKAAVPWTQRE